MKDSLKNLLGMFPYFLDKSDDSNFTKSQSVTNDQFKDIFQSLFDVGESFKLNKRCWIWKVQSVPLHYSIHFVARYPNLKNVKCYKNNDLLYMEEYTYDEFVDSFSYVYDTTEENTTPTEIIPNDTFKIIVETYDELTITKGYPENDNIEGDEFDHDQSLDNYGKLNNIPRKQYITVDPSEYPYTEPPYNNRLTEDDYHYMNRIIEYNLRLQDTPLPVLEIWKLFGIDSLLENREKYLLKMFDETKHGTDWIPEIWEHKDKLCSLEKDLGEYFFASANTIIPVKNEDVVLTFRFLNSLAEPLTGNYTIGLKINDTSIVSDYTNLSYTISSSDLEDDTENVVVITAYNDSVEFATETIRINVRGCSNADWYVASNGSDSNNGKTSNTAFATLGKALSSLNGDGDLIVIGAGDYTQDSTLSIHNSCTILGCGDVSLENTNDNIFFSLPVNCTLTLQDLTLKYDTVSLDVANYSFVNENPNNQLLNVFIDEPFEEET